MPADAYGFRPAAGAADGMRTFGEQVTHAATVVYLTAAIVLGERSPYAPGPGDNGPPGLDGKADILDYLEGAFAYARRAVASLGDDNWLEPVQTYFGPQPRAQVAMGIAAHSYNHYGQMAVYARLCGIVPPASREADSEATNP